MTTPPRSPRRRTPAAPPAGGRQAVVDVLAQIIEPLGAALPPTCEVLLHDLSKLPDSIVAIHGDVTGRAVGDPATDLLLQHVVAGGESNLVGYETKLRDGRRLQSTTIMVKGADGRPAAALCINTDVSAWLHIESIAKSMAGHSVPTEAVGASEPSPEEFFNDMDELAAHLLSRSIAEVGVPVDLMRKEHKVAAVERLQDRGMFLLRGAVESVAAALGVSRFAIYKYLNELNGDADGSAFDTPRGARKDPPDPPTHEEDP